MSVYRRLCAIAKDPPEGNPSLAEMIYGLIRKQARTIENLRISTDNDLVYYGLRSFNLAEAICLNCRQPLPQDTEAKWSVMRLGHYVLRRRRCSAGLCQWKLRAAVPRDPSIPFVWANQPDLSIKSARSVREAWRSGIRDPRDCEGKLSHPIESWCI